jgi:Domain of unknown function (DUF2935)
LHGSSAPVLATPYARYMAQAGFQLVARNPGHGPESDTEKQFLLVDPGNHQPRDHAWATARFAIDTLAEHAYLFALLMPPEVARPQREQALLLAKQHRRLLRRIDVQGPPAGGEVRAFTRTIRDEMRPIIEFKQECHDLQASGELRSLAWPLLFEHTRREAEHFEDRLDRIGGGDVTLDAKATVGFWGHVFDEHHRFTAHLLDPAEQTLVRSVLRRSEGFQACYKGLAGEGGDLDPASEANAMLEMAEETLDFATDTARKVEAARLHGILVPMLADHLRREAVWGVDELRRLEG